MGSFPAFAVIGHPNEGKSSVLSTLTEDDSVAVSVFPGETIQCQSFPIKINGETVLTFYDTPGFQNPRRVLAWMQESGLTDDELLDAFLAKHLSIPEFHHDCELMKPLKQGAGMIYVVDCSRPLLEEDRAEMEILRLVNRPRMAVINFKDDERDYLQDWKTEFRRHFNVIREFNAHQAGFADRMALFETLKAIHQDWENTLNQAIEAFQKDWLYRKERVSELIVEYLEWALNFKLSNNYSRNSDVDRIREALISRYQAKIIQREKRLFKEIKRLYRHQVFDFKLPEQSILHEELFSEKTWQILGLTQKQLLMTATGTGAGIGAALDIAVAGLSFGVFTTAGALLGGGSAFFKGKDLARIKIKNLPLGGSQITAGPNKNPQFPYVVLDRCLLFYEQIKQRAHGKRDARVSEHQVVELTQRMKENSKFQSAVRAMSSNNASKKIDAMQFVTDYLHSR